MTDRITLLIKAKNLSAAQFADEIGVQRSSISHLISGRNKPSLDLIQKTLQRFPEVSTEWLLFGKGEMVRELNLFNTQTRHGEKDEKLPMAAFGERETLFYMPQDADNAASTSKTAELNPIREGIAMPSSTLGTDPNMKAGDPVVENSVRAVDKIAGKKESAINQIIVFYDDRTFIAYSPGN